MVSNCPWSYCVCEFCHEVCFQTFQYEKEKIIGKNPYPFGPYAIVGRVVTCEICGHQYIGSGCVFCEKTHTHQESVAWTDEIIKQQEKKDGVQIIKQESGKTGGRK